MPDTIIDEEQQGEKKQDESVVIDGQDIESEVIDPQQIIDEPEPEKQPEPQPEPEKQPEPQPEPKPKAPLGKSRLPGLSDELKKTKRRFFSDSDLYRETVLRLDAVNAMLETVVNPGNFQKIAPLALDRYQQLLESCNAYLNSRKSRFTDTGKTRAAETVQVYIESEGEKENWNLFVMKYLNSRREDRRIARFMNTLKKVVTWEHKMRFEDSFRRNGEFDKIFSNNLETLW